jgi:hypothetical protein
MLTVKCTMLQQCNSHKFTWTSSDGKNDNLIDHMLMARRQYLSVLSI